LAAIEIVVGSWLDAGDYEGAGLALDRMRARLGVREATGLARGVEALLRARLLLAREDVGGATVEANRAVAALRAPWWRAKAIRLLEQAGAASPSVVEEAERIEARLAHSISRRCRRASDPRSRRLSF